MPSPCSTLHTKTGLMTQLKRNLSEGASDALLERFPPVKGTDGIALRASDGPPGDVYVRALTASQMRVIIRGTFSSLEHVVQFRNKSPEEIVQDLESALRRCDDSVRQEDRVYLELHFNRDISHWRRHVYLESFAEVLNNAAGLAGNQTWCWGSGCSAGNFFTRAEAERIMPLVQNVNFRGVTVERITGEILEPTLPRIDRSKLMG